MHVNSVSGIAHEFLLTLKSLDILLPACHSKYILGTPSPHATDKEIQAQKRLGNLIFMVTWGGTGRVESNSQPDSPVPPSGQHY